MAAPSVRRRLTLSFLAILALFAANQAINIGSDRARTRAFAELDRALHRRVLIASVRQQLADLHKEVTLLGEVRFEPGSAPNPAARAGFDEKLAHLTADIDTLQALATGGRAADIRVLRQNVDEVAGMWRKFYEYLGVEPAWSVAFLARADPLSRRIFSKIFPRIEADGNRSADLARREFDSVNTRTRTTTLLIFLVSVVLAVVVASRISAYLVGRLTELRRGADLIGDQDLEHRIRVEPRDEMGDLADHFNEMAVRLGAAQSKLRQANAELGELNVILSQRIEEELARVRLAARIQRDLLPKEAPRIPGYDLAGRSIPAQTVGGDYFDFLFMDPSRLALCLGDVSGKGLPASLLMANLQAAIRSQVLACASVADCLRHTNTLLYRSTDAGKFATAFYCVLDLDRHEIRFSNAGHNPPLLFRDGRAERLEEGGLMLGAFEEATFVESSSPLEPGDVLVIYSDGITEAMDGGNQEFGEEGLVEVVNRERERSAEDMLDAIVRAALDFTGDRLQGDDMTLLVLKRA